MTKTAWAIMGTLLSLMSGTVAAASTGADPLRNQITVSTYDFAGVGSKTLGQAEQLAGTIFALAGVDAQWRTGLGNRNSLINDFSAPILGQCDAPLPEIVTVQIISNAPRGLPLYALGQALPCSKRGIQVTVYTDRLDYVSRTTFAAFYRVLGHALAHELGHVLLGSPLHSDCGLMKSVWSKSDWQRAAISMIPFEPEQASVLIRRLQPPAQMTRSRNYYDPQ
jgi:hypothetical protein